MASADSVAFLGTGLMGAPMAARLIRAGYSVRLWNRSPEKTQPLEAMGGRICESVGAAVQGARFVCLCLANAKAVEEVVFGRGSMPKHLTPGSIMIDFSTIGVSPTREFARRLADESGAVWLDCPVSGGVAGAQAGSLVAFSGGDEAAIERALPVLQQVAMRVNRMGAVGAGQAAKLCNQLIVATNLVAIAEAMASAKAWASISLSFPLRCKVVSLIQSHCKSSDLGWPGIRKYSLRETEGQSLLLRRGSVA